MINRTSSGAKKDEQMYDNTDNGSQDRNRLASRWKGIDNKTTT